MGATDSSTSDAGCCSFKSKKVGIFFFVLGLAACGGFFFWVFSCAHDAGEATKSIAAAREHRLKREKEEIKEKEERFIEENRKKLKGYLLEPTPDPLEEPKIPEKQV